MLRINRTSSIDRYNIEYIFPQNITADYSQGQNRSRKTLSDLTLRKDEVRHSIEVVEWLVSILSMQFFIVIS